MLVLSRKEDQRIRIGDNIEIVVISIDGGHVKLGIQAPREIPVLRHELIEEVQDENRLAAATAMVPLGLGSLFPGLGHPPKPVRPHPVQPAVQPGPNPA